MSQLLKTSFQQSATILAEYWPLSGFIANNPLWDCTNKPFWQMINMFAQESAADKILVSQQATDVEFQPAIEWVKHRYLQDVLALFADLAKQPLIQQQGKNVFSIWCKVKHQDFTLNTDDDYYSIMQQLLDNLAIPSQYHGDYLVAIWRQIYGIASLTKWLNCHPGNPWLQFECKLEALVVIWLWYEKQLTNKLPQQAKAENPIEERGDDKTENYLTRQEVEYQKELFEQLIQNTKKEKQQVEAQMIFCIDTRSEPLRRHLEQQGNITTYGYAGFFGFGFKCKQPTNTISFQCPALISPEQQVTIKQKLSVWLKLQRNMSKAISITKKQLLAPFNLFEIVGFAYVLNYICRTFLPDWFAKLNHQRFDKLVKRLKVDLDSNETEHAAVAGFNLLKTIGLTTNFAPSVILCGHQSLSSNNPFAASLDCGACGGNSGMLNAIVACEWLNKVEVRQKIAALGIVIPEKTKFVAAVHLTTYDKIHLFADMPRLKSVFTRACYQVVQEKLQRYPMLNSLKRRQYDWAQLIPEYGLLNNAALIIAPRRVTYSLNLQGRVFLHSYDEQLDSDNSILESILLAPMVVAHWINMQYYFSSQLPHLFSAGNKAIHNIVPNLGVIEGNASDLKIGLPIQSFRYRGNNLHQPLRLTVVIYADIAKVKTVISKHNKLQQLIENQWLFIFCHQQGEFMRL